MKEFFDIPGYEGLYAITKRGDVWAYPTNTREGMWLQQSLSGTPGRKYYMVRLSKGGTRNGKLINRLVAQTFIPNPENKPQTNHIDSNSMNNHVDNLEWVTAKENIEHSMKHGKRTKSCMSEKYKLPSPRQQETLIHIKRFIKDNQYPPTTTELMKLMGIKSVNGIIKHLSALKKKGYIERSSKARSIVIKE